MNQQEDEDILRQQRGIMEELGMTASRRHIFLCCDQTKPKCCGLEESLEAWNHLKQRLKELGLSEQGGIQRTKANCLRVCYEGPIAVVYPEGAWYSRCDKLLAPAGDPSRTSGPGSKYTPRPPRV